MRNCDNCIHKGGWFYCGTCGEDDYTNYYEPLYEESDNVNHPKHYTREGGIECIDEMVALFGRKAVMTFCKLNAWKYRYRASDKNGVEDLEKSDWYIQKFIELGGENK